jgi:hypothetical protein
LLIGACLLLASWATTIQGRSALPAAPSAPLDRPADPVVLTGADLPMFASMPPQLLVAWRYRQGWQQIPVQVDERASIDFGTIYHQPSPSGITQLVYTDPSTWTGGDPNPLIDADDEIVFMAQDSGERPATWSEPSHVVARSGIEIALSDPLAPERQGFVYLFQQDGSLDPGAGAQYVSYSFNLLSGNYKATYDPNQGPHPENSTVTSPAYRTHFADRWINDQLHITAGGVERPDILDRHKALFSPGDCNRSEDTFANGAAPFPVGVFIANKSGPVRAIRSYMGANSGPLTQRDQIFYAQRQDIRTMLRVHSIPGIMDFYDYSPDANGMTYYNNLNLAGLSIDGTPDQPVAGVLEWELITGSQGSLVNVFTTTTDIDGFTSTSYYLDSTSPATAQCTGDAFAYGASGAWVNQGIPCTDPLPQALGGTCPTSYHTLSTTRTIYYAPPGVTTTTATRHAVELARPLQHTIQLWQPAAATPSPTGTATRTPMPTRIPTVTPSATPRQSSPALLFLPLVRR